MARSSNLLTARKSRQGNDGDETSIRLEEVLAENAFLGEALQSSRSLLRKVTSERNAEVVAMKKRQQELEKQLETKTREMSDWKRMKQTLSLMKETSNEAVEECRRIRQEKCSLLEHSWQCLQQLRDLEDDNKRLRSEVATLRSEFERSTPIELSVEDRENADKFLSDELTQQSVIDNVNIVVGVIERIEKEASAAKKLSVELDRQQRANILLKRSLGESEKKLALTTTRMNEILQREQRWVKLVQSETKRILQLQSACTCQQHTWKPHQ